jgi:hypothetical protein
VVQEKIEYRERGDFLLSPSSKSLQESHQLAVQNIAEQLFPFPTPEFPHFRTFVNEPEVQQRVFTNYGNDLTPDIVVLQWPEKLPVMIAEVVTPDMLTEQNAVNVWAVEARLAGVRFFLYVPAGHSKAAKKLLKNAKVKDVAVRTWRNITGLKTIDVSGVR